MLLFIAGKISTVFEKISFSFFVEPAIGALHNYDLLECNFSSEALSDILGEKPSTPPYRRQNCKNLMRKTYSTINAEMG